MSNLINSVYKAQLESAINDIHDTWKKEITVFKAGKVVTLAVTDDYAHMYRSRLNNDTETEVQEMTIDARVYYYKSRAELLELGPTNSTNINLQDAKSEVRIKVNKTDSSVITDAKTIVINDFSFRVDSPPIPHGIIDTQYHTFVLTRIQ